jgi:hypothetical protein
MALEDLRLRNTQELMEQVAARISLDDDSVTLVLVDLPSTQQQILSVRRLDVPATQASWEPLRDLLYKEMWALPVPPRSEGFHSIVVTIICRPGYNVWSSIESTWALGWRYSNHNSGAFDEDIIVVTEHGWASLMTGAAGHEPRLRSTKAA